MLDGVEAVFQVIGAIRKLRDTFKTNKKTCNYLWERACSVEQMLREKQRKPTPASNTALIRLKEVLASVHQVLTQYGDANKFVQIFRSKGISEAFGEVQKRLNDAIQDLQLGLTLGMDTNLDDLIRQDREQNV